MSAPGHPTLLFGGGTVGNTEISQLSDVNSVSALLDRLPDLGIDHIDTAARYPDGYNGRSEELFGLSGVGARGFVVDTKVMVKGRDVAGSLSLDAVRKSVPDSLERLKVSRVNTLYAHAPDPTTPLEEQVRALDEQCKKAACNQLGLSMFPPDLLEQWLQLCDEKDYIKPKVYQGMYNLIRRGPEKDLFPILREHGVHFVASSPLAAGVLTGNLTAGTVDGTRFAKGSKVGEGLRGVFDRPETHEAIAGLARVLKPLGISSIEAALRWLFYHSLLGEGDGVILGASRTEQVVQNVDAIKKGPLPDEVVRSIEAIWDLLGEASGN